MVGCLSTLMGHEFVVVVDFLMKRASIHTNLCFNAQYFPCYLISSFLVYEK